MVVLDGFPLTSDAKLVRYPDRYMDERGAAMWNLVMGLIGEIEEVEENVAPVRRQRRTGGHQAISSIGIFLNK